MSIASNLFKRFQAARNEATRPARLAYLDALRTLAAGDETDADELDMICAQLEIDEQRLQQDIQTMESRLQAAQRLEISKQTEPELKRLQVKEQQMHQQKAEFLQKWNADFAELRDKLVYAMTAVNSNIQATQVLRETVMDSELTGRIEENEKQRRKVISEIAVVQAELDNKKSGPVGSAFEAARSLSNLEVRSKGNYRKDPTLAKQVQQWQQILAENEPAVRALEMQLQHHKRQLQRLDQIGQQLEQEKLNP